MVLHSRNRKTGCMPVSTTEASTCPPGCGLRRICYAHLGPSSLHWRRVPEKGLRWADFVAMVAELPKGTLWRHNEAGDLPGEGNHIDASALAQLVEANKGKRGFTYTHKPVLGRGAVAARNRELIRQANVNGFTINLSADTLAHADKLAELHIGPVAVALEHDAQEDTTTPSGRPVVICPHRLDPQITCNRCGICWTVGRPIVGLPAHGARKRQHRA